MSHKTEELKSVFFPSHCVFCRKAVEEDYLAICDDCAKLLPEPPKSRRGEFFSTCISAMPYDDMVRTSILRMKMGAQRSYNDTYGKLIAARLQEKTDGNFDLITWVPASAFHRLQRGFDQSEMMAQTVSGCLGIPARKLLKKRRHTRTQSRISDASHRRANVLNAFKTVKDPAIEGKCVLLIDDVITTGATLSECSRVLRLAGASKIVCATFAATNKSR